VTCAQARELAPELALGILGGAERAEVVEHVNSCARCQAYVAELTEVGDALPLLAPEAEPSRGFDDRVLAAIAAPRRASRRRWIAAVAVAAAAAAILSITIVRVVESNDTTTSRVAAPTAAPVVIQMKGGENGLPAGWASVSDSRNVTVAVDYGVPQGKYTIRLASSTGNDAVDIGTMDIDVGGRGFWAGSSGQPITSASTIALVDSSGQEACHGKVPAPQ
jgi:hypothetical protein